MAKFSVKKALAVVGCLTALGAGVFFGIDAVSDDFNVVFYPETTITRPTPDPTPDPIPVPDPTPVVVQLAAPAVTYDQETNLLSWSEVDNASGYRVTVNGQTKDYGADTTELEVTIDEGDSYTMSVQALGDGENYSNSEISTITGERENLDQMYYEQIEDNIYKFFEDYMYAGRNKVEIQDILNIDLQNNVFSVLTKCNDENRPTTLYRTFSFDLSNYINYTNDITLKDLAEASNNIKNIEDSYVNVQLNAGENYSFADNLYNKLISDNLLNGNLKSFIDNGYTINKLYSEPDMGDLSKDIVVNTCVKLQKGNDIKVVTVQNFITQKFNNAYGFAQYAQAYIDGTAEDVEIQETAFTESSPVSSIWQAANDKFDKQEQKVTNYKNLNNIKYESMLYSQNGKQYKLTYPVDDYTIEY